MAWEIVQARIVMPRSGQSSDQRLLLLPRNSPSALPAETLRVDRPNRRCLLQRCCIVFSSSGLVLQAPGHASQELDAVERFRD